MNSTSSFPNPFLIAGRLAGLAVVVLYDALTYVPEVLLRGGSLEARVTWLHRCCRRTLRVLGLRFELVDPAPERGLLVSNHLSYLDILVLSACAPAVFVSKEEVRNWPVFGWFARLSGTLFIERGRRADVGRSQHEIRALLDRGALVVLFPEGTSSDGSTVLPFKSSLLEPIAGLPHPLTAACLDYSLADGNVAADVCYWGDMTLVPHLLKLLGRRGLTARVRFTALREGHACRKTLARQLHAEVLRLKTSPAA